MNKPLPAGYSMKNWSSYNEALRTRGSMLIWIDRKMAWFAPPEKRPGRSTVFWDAAIQFCLSVKVLLQLPLRQTAGMVAHLLRLAGLDWTVPDFSTLCRRQKTLVVQIPYRRVDGRLNLLVHSTGIKFLGDGEWQARKHGVRGRRQWRKVHLAMDTATSDIRAIEFTPSGDGDSPIKPDLLGQIPKDEQIGTVTADEAYHTRRCQAAITARLAVPIIPVRKNGRPWKENGPAAKARNETLRATKHYGKAFWNTWTGFHARSRVEAKMRGIKEFGERIAAKDPDLQTAEIPIRVALMNRFNALGTAEIVRVA
ncbi:IS5 family transposase [Thioclava sp. DLFJ4-1]|uniref:IS5 family transposase n=1 Tax=Thioclava sp. DLFJ4-1 TaxID=1915313 RepID=UPI0009965AE3|nr:IS5 family transposase [Thioclava sp. DLFJ4-1]OOY14404.1 IS5 family transposase [Thioclava sp. DLFJ4-1]